jgi:hypothetical protein
MLDWLNTNAGAVQGISAVLTAVVTMVLVLITWRYVTLTDQLARSAQDQFKLGQQQFKLAETQYILPYLPHFALNAQATLENPQVYRYSFANLGTTPVLMHSVKFCVKSDKRVFTIELKGLVGRAIPPMKAGEEPLKGQFVIPDEVWAEGLDRIPITEVGARVSSEAIISDVAHILKFVCRYNALTGYRVEKI